MTGPEVATRVMKARRVSECPACRRTITVGQLIAKCGYWMHASCAIEHQHDQPREPMIGWHSGA